MQSLTAYFYQFVTTRYTTDFYITSTVIYLSFSLFANRLPFRSRQLPLLLFLYQRALIAVERGIEYAIKPTNLEIRCLIQATESLILQIWRSAYFARCKKQVGMFLIAGFQCHAIQNRLK